MGIQTVYQALAPDLGTAANLYLGRELLAGDCSASGMVVVGKQMARKAHRVLIDLDVTIKDATAPVAPLSGGQRHRAVGS